MTDNTERHTLATTMIGMNKARMLAMVFAALLASAAGVNYPVCKSDTVVACHPDSKHADFYVEQMLK